MSRRLSIDVCTWHLFVPNPMLFSAGCFFDCMVCMCTHTDDCVSDNTDIWQADACVSEGAVSHRLKVSMVYMEHVTCRICISLCMVSLRCEL